MGTKVRFAVWRKLGKVFYAKPPDWPKSTEYSCTDQETLIQWAHNHGYVLKDGNPSKRDGRSYNERFAARDFG
jgi:hypothetical protein